MRKSKVFKIQLWIGILVIFLSACGKEAPASFPVYTEESIIKLQKENVIIDAEVSVPVIARDGKVVWAEGTTMKLIQRREELKDEFMKGAVQPQFSQLEDTEFFSLTDYPDDGMWKVFAYNDSSNFFFYTRESEYRSACIELMAESDDYNGDQYQKVKDLDFMSQEDAVSYIQATVEKYGISLGEPVAAYAMDYQTMQMEENVTDLDGTPLPEQAKPEWSSEDDTYYFFFYQEYQDMPVMYHMYSQQGFLPGEEATVMLTENGIIDINIQGCYDWEEQGEVSLISAEEAAETFLQNYQGIYDTKYQVNHIKLMLDIVSGVDNKVKLWPVWVFETEMSGMNEEYTVDYEIVIDAVSGQEMAYG